MAYQIDYAYTCHKGKVRSNNEDNFWCCGTQMPARNEGTDGVCIGNSFKWDFPVLAVFDGMGGESCGEMAAYVAAQELGRCYQKNKRNLKKYPENFLESAAADMNQAVCRYARENRICSMGTTMAMAAFGSKEIYICNLGDSRIYYSFEGQLCQLSTDHVLKGNLLGKPPLTQYLGIQEENMVPEIMPVTMDYKKGGRYLICSDGVTDMLSDGEIADVLTRENAVGETVKLLLERTLRKGGRDNITIILCEIQEQEPGLAVLEWMKRYKKKDMKVMYK